MKQDKYAFGDYSEGRPFTGAWIETDDSRLCPHW